MSDTTMRALEMSRESKRGDASEAFIRLYVEATGSKVEDLELVEQRIAYQEAGVDGFSWTWYVRPRNEPSAAALEEWRSVTREARRAVVSFLLAQQNLAAQALEQVPPGKAVLLEESVKALGAAVRLLELA